MKSPIGRSVIGASCLFVVTTFAVSAQVASRFAEPTYDRAKAEESIQNYVDTVVTKQGQMAPTFRVDTLRGGAFDLAAQRGKVVVIYYFTTWCGWCRRLEPHFAREITARFKDDPNFVTIAIAREEDEATLRRYVRGAPTPFPIAADPERRVYGQYATSYVPRLFVIDRDGKIAYQRGELDRGYIEALYAEGDRDIPYGELMTERLRRIAALIESELARAREVAAR